MYITIRPLSEKEFNKIKRIFMRETNKIPAEVYIPCGRGSVLSNDRSWEIWSGDIDIDLNGYIYIDRRFKSVKGPWLTQIILQYGKGFSCL